jgi:hypothetical protein
VEIERKDTTHHPPKPWWIDCIQKLGFEYPDTKTERQEGTRNAYKTVPLANVSHIFHRLLVGIGLKMKIVSGIKTK